MMRLVFKANVKLNDFNLYLPIESTILFSSECFRVVCMGVVCLAINVIRNNSVRVDNAA